jgi:hypothetical protein
LLQRDAHLRAAEVCIKAAAEADRVAEAEAGERAAHWAAEIDKALAYRRNVDWREVARREATSPLEMPLNSIPPKIGGATWLTHHGMELRAPGGDWKNMLFSSQHLKRETRRGGLVAFIYSREKERTVLLEKLVLKNVYSSTTNARQKSANLFQDFRAQLLPVCWTCRNSGGCTAHGSVKGKHI